MKIGTEVGLQVDRLKEKKRPHPEKKREEKNERMKEGERVRERGTLGTGTYRDIKYIK